MTPDDDKLLMEERAKGWAALFVVAVLGGGALVSMLMDWVCS